MKKSKRFCLLIVLSLLLLSISLTSLTSCFAIANENKKLDVERIAKEEFRMNFFVVISLGSTDSFLVAQQISRGLIYVLGEKDNKEIRLLSHAPKKSVI